MYKFKALAIAALCLSAASTSAAEMVITSENPPSHWKSQQLDALAADISKRTDGRIAAKTYHATLYKGDKEALEAVGTGAVHMVWPASTRMEALAPAFSLLTVPFGLTDEQMSDPARQLRVATVLSALVEDRGLQVLGIARATEAVIVGKKHVETLEDLKGLKIRAPGSPLMTDMLAAMGAGSVSLAASEMATALSQGAIDGAFTSAGGWKTIGATVAPYGVQAAGLNIASYTVVVDKSWLDRLDAADRDAVVAATFELMQRQWQEAKAGDDAALEEMREAGATVTRIEGAALEPFKAAMTPVREKYMSQYADVSAQLQEALK